MYEETLKKLSLAKKELEIIAEQLGFDILEIVGDKRVSLNKNFPILLDEKSKDLSKKDLLRFLKAFFTFQHLTLICLDRVILTSLNESIKTTFEKKRNLENKIWKNYFEKLMGDKDL